MLFNKSLHLLRVIGKAASEQRGAVVIFSSSPYYSNIPSNLVRNFSIVHHHRTPSTSKQVQEFLTAHSSSTLEPGSGGVNMSQTMVNGNGAQKNNPDPPQRIRRPPRRIKSLSEALDLIGTSVEDIYAKKKSVAKKILAKSNENLNEELKEESDYELQKDRAKVEKKRNKSKERKSNQQQPNVIVAPPTPPPVIITSKSYDSEEEEDEEELMTDDNDNIEISIPVPQMNKINSIKNKSTSETNNNIKKLSICSNSSQGSNNTNNSEGESEEIKIKIPSIMTKSLTESNKTSAPQKDNQLTLGPKRRDRSASMVWVDFLTQEGVSTEERDYENEEDERRSSIGNHSKRRLTWFAQTDSEEEKPNEEDAEKLKDRRSSSIKNEPEKTGHKNVDDLIFDMFREKDEDVLLVGKFLAALEKTGLKRDDPRLVELFVNLKRVHKEQELAFPKRNVGSVETLSLDRDTFQEVITDNIVLISRAFRQQFIIPEFQTFCGQIEELYYKTQKIKTGKAASYIPQLARINPEFWGVSICTIDGQRWALGDTHVPFTLQSTSKPLTYAIALNELGSEVVHNYVGQEPSGRMFNELVLDYNKKPHNPMVNAGAIIVCSLLKTLVHPEMTLAEKFDYTFDYFKRLGGGEHMGFNNAVFLSEREAADRNYALGFYMREYKCFPEGTNLKECMDYYFQCCSMETNCETAAVISATLANGGICPITGEKVLKSDSVRDVLSLMHSCGMYDYSGQFAFKVGLPAKSGVSGCILLVVPNVFGMAVYAPPLDSLGNPVKGVQFCQELVSMFNFHKYDNLRHVSNKIDPRKHRYETKGLNIVNLLFSAASGDVTSMRRHHLSGMDMSASDYDGRSALHLAAAEGHLECVEYLLKTCHVAHDPSDRWGHLPLDEAERFEHGEVADFLREWSAKQNKILNPHSN